MRLSIASKRREGFPFETHVMWAVAGRTARPTENTRPPDLILEAQESGLVMKEKTQERAGDFQVLGDKVWLRNIKIRHLLEARYEKDPERERRSGDTIKARVQQHSRTLAAGTTAH